MKLNVMSNAERLDFLKQQKKEHQQRKEEAQAELQKAIEKEAAEQQNSKTAEQTKSEQQYAFIAYCATKGRRNHIKTKKDDTLTTFGKFPREKRNGATNYVYLDRKANILKQYMHSTNNYTLEFDTDKIGAEDLRSEAKVAFLEAKNKGASDEEAERIALLSVGRNAAITHTKQAEAENSAVRLDDENVHISSSAVVKFGSNVLPEYLLLAIAEVCKTFRNPLQAQEIVIRVLADGESVRDCAEHMEINRGVVDRTVTKAKTALASVLSEKVK